jgi:hypothetical protein
LTLHVAEDGKREMYCELSFYWYRGDMTSSTLRQGNHSNIKVHDNAQKCQAPPSGVLAS